MAGHLKYDLTGRSPMYAFPFLEWVLITSPPVVWSHNHRREMIHFQKLFNSFHTTQPIQIAKYGLNEISGEEEIFISLNSNIVSLNTITKTAKTIPCNIKVINNASQEYHKENTSDIHPVYLRICHYLMAVKLNLP